MFLDPALPILSTSGRRGKILLAIGLSILAISPATASERRPEAPVFPVIDPSIRPPAPQRSVPPHSIRLEEYAPGETGLLMDLPTHIFFANGLEIISEVTADRLSYRVVGSGSEWLASPLPVNGPHAVSYCSDSQLYYAADTESNRILAFTRIDDDAHTSTDTIAGSFLTRPHDMLFDPATRLSYVLNANQTTLFRFSEFGVEEAALDLSLQAGGYSRGISLVNGTVIVAASALGLVVEINDFDSGNLTIHPTYGKIAAAAAGSWDTTGFIPNDVEFYDGYWYLSNFFHPSYANGTDPNRFKLVRFQTWNDLETGQWEELSHLLPDSQIPYFFTLHRGSLYLAAFDAVVVDDAVYKITSGLFFDNFESGGLEAWSFR